MTFQDESHIIYVNGEYEGDNSIGNLMHDFACANPDEMRSKLLAEKTRYYKQNDKGVRRMSKIMEELFEEERAIQSEEYAISLLEIGKMTYEEIATASKLPESKIKQLAEQLKAEPILQ